MVESRPPMGKVNGRKKPSWEELGFIKAFRDQEIPNGFRNLIGIIKMKVNLERPYWKKSPPT